MADPLRPTIQGAVRLAFGEFVLDGARYELRRNGKRLAIQRKPLLLLFYLVQNAERLVPTSELMREIWQGVAVTDASLRKAIKLVRRVIGPSAGIESVRGVGYRFVVPAPLADRESVAPPESGEMALGALRDQCQVGMPIPGPGSGPRQPGSLVGRRDELGALERALERALGGESRTTMVVGPAGIGKTRLIREFSEIAQRRGFRVVLGCCSEGQGCPGFWPWGPVLARLALERSQVPLEADSAPTRFRMFADIVEMLRRRSEQEPLLVVLEDIHWAQEPALFLLKFVVEQLHQARVMVLATYRDGDLAPSEACTGTIGAVQARGRLVLMRPLGEADIAELLAAESTLTVTPNLVSTVYGWTGGNPLFIHELIPLLEAQATSTSARSGASRSAASGEFEPVRLVPPAGIQEVIRAQLRPLGARASQVLSTSALFGVEFELSLLNQVASVQAEELQLVLRDAVARRILTEVSAGGYRFAHALIRDVLAEALPPLDRAALHARIAEVLEAAPLTSDALTAALAHHYAQALPVLSSASKPIHFALAAARAAMRRLAYEQARDHALAALSLAERAGATPTERAEILRQLGEAQRYCGATDAAKVTFTELARLGREVGEPLLLVQAALGYGRAHTETGLLEHPLIHLLEEGLSVLPPGDSTLRAELLARYGRAKHVEFDAAERHTHTREALEMARRLGNESTLVATLSSRVHALWGARDPALRHDLLPLIDETIERAQRVTHFEHLAAGRTFRVACLLEHGLAQEAYVEFDHSARLAERLQSPPFLYFRNVTRAAFALLEGRLTTAEELAEQALVSGDCVGRVAEAFYWVQQLLIARDRGELASLLPKLAALRGIAGTTIARAAGTALVLSGSGQREAARDEIERLLAADLEKQRFDPNWLFWSVLVGRVAADVGEVHAAQRFYELLAPYPDCVPACGTVAAVAGFTTLTLGRLAARLGRSDALAHLAAARHGARRMGAKPEQARCEVAIARLYAERGDLEAARPHAEIARDLANAMGMKRVLLELEELRRSHPTIST